MFRCRLICGLNVLPFSCLRLTAEWIRASSHKDALSSLGLSFKKEGYESLEDFVLCKVAPVFEAQCRTFYKGKRGNLPKTFGDDGAKIIDVRIVATLQAFFDRYKKFRYVREEWTWTDVANLHLRLEGYESNEGSDQNQGTFDQLVGRELSPHG